MEQNTQAPGAGAGTRPARGPFGAVLRWTGIALGGTLATLLAVVVVFVAFGITVDLSGLRPRIEAAASTALDRRVLLEGPIQLVPTLQPTLQVEGIRVGNLPEWPEADFATLALGRAQLAVLPLLRGDVEIVEITVEGVRLNLVTNAEGQPNWLPTDAGERAEAAPDPEPEPAAEPEAARSPTLRFIELKELSLTDIEVTHRNEAIDRTVALRLDTITGAAEDAKPMNLALKGSLQDVPYEATVTAGSLETLVGGGAPWALDFAADAAGTSLTLAGEIAEPLRGQGLALDFALTGPEMSELEAILGTALPPVRSIEIKGRIEDSEGAYRITGLEGVLGGTDFSGALELDTSGLRPRATGRLEVPRLDAGPLAAAVAAAEEAQAARGQEAEAETPAADEAGAALDPDEPILTLDALEAFEADFILAIGEVVNSQFAISDASLQVRVAEGALTGPIGATVAEVPFKGELRLEPRDGEPAASVTLSATGSDIGQLLSLMASVEGVEGAFQSADLSFSARGETLRSLVKTAELRFAIAGAALSYGNKPGEEPIEFTLESFEMDFPAAAESRIAAKGTLLKEPFSLEIGGGTFVENYVQRDWPLDLSASGGGAELRVTGRASRDPERAGAGIEFSLAGERIGGLSRWIGIAPEADLAYALRGSVSLAPGRLGARIDEGRIGETTLAGDLGIRDEDGSRISVLALKVGNVDLRQLAGLAPPKPETPEPEAEGEAFTIDVPILPQGLELADSDIDISVERIRMDPSDITDLAFSARIRNGRVEEAPLRAALAGAVIEGNASTDLRGEVPSIDLALLSKDLDVGGLLAQLGVAEGLEMTAGRFDMELALRGATARSMMKASSFSSTITDGLLTLRDPNTQGSLDIEVPEGRIEAPVDRPIALTLDGRIQETPIAITIETDSLASFAEPKDKLGATLNAKILNAELTFSGSAPLPVDKQNLDFALDITGDRFSDFNQLLDVSLPSWGPYKLAGAFGSQNTGYYIKDLELGVGSSALTGALDLDTTGAKPRLTASFTAPSVQLDDFRDPDRGEADAKVAEAETSSETAEAEAGTVSETDESGRKLLSPEVLGSLDGTLAVSVEQVSSGQDALGSGVLKAELKDGRFAVEPLTLEVPGGKVDIGFAVEPSESDVALEARAAIDRLDYGLLARRIDPESDTGGRISVDVDLKTRGKSLSEIMGGANGHINFAVWPKDLEAGIFDLWAVNLFTAIMPSLDSEASVVNCLVARFTLEDGIMRPDALLIDSSRIQASGDGKIDFVNNTIDFGASPRSKRPQLFSAQTPIAVKGRLEDFQVGLPRGALAGTVVRMITSPVVVPFQWVFTSNEPPDGKIACAKAWGGPTPFDDTGTE